MGRVIAGLGVVALLAFHGAASAAEFCWADLPEGSVDVGELVSIGGGGFTPAQLLDVYVGGELIGSGPAFPNGMYSIGYTFTAPGQYPVEVWGVSSSSKWVCGAEGTVLVTGPGSLITFPSEAVVLAPTTTTTLVFSASAVPTQIVFDPPAEAGPTLEEVPFPDTPASTSVPSTTSPQATTQPPEPTGTTTNSATTAVAATDGSTPGTTGVTVAAPVGTPSGGDTSVLLLGMAITVGAVLVGLIAGWLLGRKAMR